MRRDARPSTGACIGVTGDRLATDARRAARGRDQLDVLRREVFLELRAVVGLVADEALGLLRGEALLDDVFSEAYFATFT